MKELGQELSQELVLEPIFGEWFITAHSSMKGGGGHKRGTLQSGVQANAQSEIQGTQAAVAKLSEAVKTEFLAQVKGLAAYLRNAGAWAAMQDAYQETRAAGEKRLGAFLAAVSATQDLRVTATNEMATPSPCPVAFEVEEPDIKYGRVKFSAYVDEKVYWVDVTDLTVDDPMSRNGVYLPLTVNG